MKFTYTFFILLASPIFIYSQNGRISNDSLIMENGSVFIKGSSIEIGKGSKGDGGYVSLFVAPQKMGRRIIMPVPLTAGWTGYKLKILDFKLHGSDIIGRKYYLVLNAGLKKIFYWCDAALSIDSKEIVYPR